MDWSEVYSDPVERKKETKTRTVLTDSSMFAAIAGNTLIDMVEPCKFLGSPRVNDWPIKTFLIVKYSKND